MAGNCDGVDAHVGYFIFDSARTAVYRWDGYLFHYLSYNSIRLLLIVQESAIVGLFLLFLKQRGWTVGDLKIKVTKEASSQGLRLLFINFGVLIIGTGIIRGFSGFHHVHVASKPHPYPHPSFLGFGLGIVIVSQIINAYLEEVVCMCYAFNQFAAKIGPRFALWLMLLLRISYHTYKVPAYLCITVIAFYFYGLWYWRNRNVWPLILAHALFDILIVPVAAS